MIPIKQQLYEAMRQNLRLGADSSGGQIVDGKDDLMQDLMGIMCYREIRQFVFGYNFSGRKPQWDFVLSIFIETYPGDLVLEVIEKVKKEQP